MSHLGLSRNEFNEWCKAVRLKAHQFEYSPRKYFVKGEFFAKADAKLIELLISKYGNKWGDYYAYYEDVKAFVFGEKQQNEELTPSYEPQNSAVRDFINKIKK